MLKKIIVCTTIWPLLIVGSALADTLFVPGNYKTIQEAINAAANGDTIIVSPGTYKENIDFLGKSIFLLGEKGPSVTIIDGNQSGSVVTFSSGETGDAIIEGFTLTNGTGTPYGSLLSGGGIYCDASSPTIRDNVILGNSALSNGMGGGISCWESEATIENNTISDNTTYGGGGIYLKYSDATVTDNTITSNMAGNFGGGITSHHSLSFIANNLIWANTAGSAGGISCHGSPGTKITGNIFLENTAQYGGGLTCSGSSTVTNNMFLLNIADHDGGGLRTAFNTGGSPVVTNNTFVGNRAMDGRGGGIAVCEGSVAIRNTILWGNEAPVGAYAQLYRDGWSYVSVQYSDVEGGWTGAGNIDADPAFVDAAGFDLHLTWDSPCRNTGDNDAYSRPGVDFEGDYRLVQHDRVDMGADELFYHLYHRGDVVPGGSADIRVVGIPGLYPVVLGLGSGVQDPPLSTLYGDFYLELPLAGQWNLGTIPSSGVLIVPVTIPTSWSAGQEYPFQALVGPWGGNSTWLTNLMVLTVE